MIASSQRRRADYGQIAPLQFTFQTSTQYSLSLFFIRRPHAKYKSYNTRSSWNQVQKIVNYWLPGNWRCHEIFQNQRYHLIPFFSSGIQSLQLCCWKRWRFLGSDFGDMVLLICGRMGYDSARNGSGVPSKRPHNPKCVEKSQSFTSTEGYLAGLKEVSKHIFWVTSRVLFLMDRKFVCHLSSKD